MSNTHCAVQGCKISVYNKPIGVYFHPCPASNDMRNKWLHALKNKCAVLDWKKSRICSKHFENKYFDAQRKLKDTAVPTLFPSIGQVHKIAYTSKTRVDKILHGLPQAELVMDIKKSLLNLKEPANFDKKVSDDLKCRSDAPVETQQWLLIKKQNHLNTRLLELVAQNKRHAEILQKNMDESKKNIDSHKYIIKSLQEKLVHLEEQIEILTAVESR
ncbi:uncharacterized protein LOC123873774 isoform X1 [Maniola jurtina]|uniref:uncharacterized protein LOC123873774 isoform X1 n=1 Tax=Maniola jurtina TaxID=191418 RepID=UPI001E688065|nr:uncharacterized protein LOC123873774 isoform X1 [Maniola jurtina]